MRRKTLSSPHLRGHHIPILPVNKSIIDVFADFFRYLNECSKTYIQETHPNGSELWKSFDKHIVYILSHPNGWEPAQQSYMRRAAVLAGLTTDTEAEKEGNTLQFVTEGEASLNFCITNGLTKDCMTVCPDVFPRIYTITDLIVNPEEWKWRYNCRCRWRNR